MVDSPAADMKGITSTLQRAWSTRGPLALALWPWSQVYQATVAIRRILYRLHILKTSKAAVPVIVVGNVMAGGAGKTPLVMALVRHLQHQGLQVGVITKGYGRTSDTCQEVLPNMPVALSGDEPALIKKLTGVPVFVARRRVQAAADLLATYPETQLLISDDGLQHYALARDIEITVFDDRGTGNGWLLPAGPLREPWPRSAHASAGLVLNTGQAPLLPGFKSSRQLADHAIAADGSKVLLSSLYGQPLKALAAIAHPEAFFKMLSARGLTLQETIALPDHYDFVGYPWPHQTSATILVTEKDAVKLLQNPTSRAHRVLAVPLVFEPEPAFVHALDALVAPLLAPLSAPTHLPYPHGR